MTKSYDNISIRSVCDSGVKISQRARDSIVAEFWDLDEGRPATL